MTPRERAKEATWEAGCPDWGSDDQERLEKAVEQAIIAAVEEKDKRIAELESIITHSRQADEDAWLGRKIKAAVEEEREACAKIAEHEAVTVPRGIEAYFAEGYQSAAAYIAELVRARSTASGHSAEPAEK